MDDNDFFPLSLQLNMKVHKIVDFITVHRNQPLVKDRKIYFIGIFAYAFIQLMSSTPLFSVCSDVTEL